MSRQAHGGGTSTRASSGRAGELRSRRLEKGDPDAVDVDSIDWDSVEPLKVELDPSLVEQIRARRHLKQITLRVGVEQVEEARRVAARTGLKYQAVLRRWLAQGASLARAKFVALMKRSYDRHKPGTGMSLDDLRRECGPEPKVPRKRKTGA